MSELNRTETVQAQYATSANLNTRISIHDQYSTNPLGFGNWIASQYQIEKGMNVLELGCGTGAIWRGRDDLIANCASLVLSDISPGMLETARKALKGYATISYKIVDIQSIPFADNAFDIVIANMMLYHVPDLKKGLAEVRRGAEKRGELSTALPMAKTALCPIYALCCAPGVRSIRQITPSRSKMGPQSCAKSFRKCVD